MKIIGPFTRFGPADLASRLARWVQNGSPESLQLEGFAVNDYLILKSPEEGMLPISLKFTPVHTEPGDTDLLLESISPCPLGECVTVTGYIDGEAGHESLGIKTEGPFVHITVSSAVKKSLVSSYDLQHETAYDVCIVIG